MRPVHHVNDPYYTEVGGAPRPPPAPALLNSASLASSPARSAHPAWSADPAWSAHPAWSADPVVPPGSFQLESATRLYCPTHRDSAEGPVT